MDPVEIKSEAGRKQAIHFGVPGRTLFGFYHPPVEGPVRSVAVVLCNPFGTDQTRSDRTYRRLAERLASAGFACLRFDHFGTGDSGGDEHAPDLWNAWVTDIGTAIDELRARSGVERTALFGLRLGATLAMLHAAERGDVESLVLWDPCVSGADLVTELTRLHKVYCRMERHLANAEPSGLDGEEALGAFLPRALIEDLGGVDLLEVGRRPAQRTLLVHGGNLPRADALLARLQESGAAPELQKHPGHKFLTTVSHRALVPEEVVTSIVAWLSAAHAAGPVPSGAGASRASAVLAPHGEVPVAFGPRRSLFGILTPAKADATREGLPPIVLANAGAVNRAGPHRTYVRMARRWADIGHDVFRVDLSGIGDSPVGAMGNENVPYPISGQDDLHHAARQLGGRKYILAGLCSGGDYAFQLGAHDAAIVGAWLLNPRTFTVLDLHAVESADGAPPSTSVEDVPRTLRAMVERGVDTLLVASRDDPGVSYVDAHAGAEMQQLRALGGFRRVDVDGADHTFTPVAKQRFLSDLLTEHLVAKYR